MNVKDVIKMGIIILAAVMLFCFITVKAGIGKAILVMMLIAAIVGLAVALKKFGGNKKVRIALIAGLVIMGLIILSVLFGAGRIFGTIFKLVIIAAILIALILVWHKGWLPKVARIILTVVGVILVIALIISTFTNLFKGAGKGSYGIINGNTTDVATIDNTADQQDNGVAIRVFGSEGDAKSNPYGELTGFSLLKVVDGSEAVEVSLTGTQSGKTAQASNGLFGGNSAIDYDKGTAGFVINSNEFGDGELVLVKIVCQNKGDFFSKKFAKQTNNKATYYWSFVAKPGDNTGTLQEETGAEPEPEGFGPGGVGYVVYAGQPYTTFDSFEEAVANSVTVPVKGDLVVVPYSSNSVDVTVYRAEGSGSLEAYFLGEKTEWTATLDLTPYEGTTIVVKLLYSDTHVSTGAKLQYIGFTVPAE